MSTRRLAGLALTLACLSLCPANAAFAQGASGGGAGTGSSSGVAGSAAGGSAAPSGMGGRAPVDNTGNGGVPGGPASEERIPESKSNFKTCPDGTRGDVNAGGCLGVR